MGWWDKAKDFGKKVIGKAKEAGLMYDKAKDFYGKGKEAITKLPVIGGAASKIIAEKEAMFGKKFESATGMSPGQFDMKQKQVRTMLDKVPV